MRVALLGHVVYTRKPNKTTCCHATTAAVRRHGPSAERRGAGAGVCHTRTGGHGRAGTTVSWGAQKGKTRQGEYNAQPRAAVGLSAFFVETSSTTTPSMLLAKQSRWPIKGKKRNAAVILPPLCCKTTTLEPFAPRRTRMAHGTETLPYKPPNPLFPLSPLPYSRK